MKINIIGKIICLTLTILISAITNFSQSEGGNRPSVAVIPFTTTGYVNSGANVELSDLLINELVNSNRLRVVDRDTLKKAADIEKLKALSGEIDSATAAEIGKTTGAQFLVSGRVTELNEEKLGGISRFSLYQASLKFNLRVIHTTTNEIVYSQNFEKNGKSIGLAKSGTLYGNVKSKEMQDTIGKSISEVSSSITEKILAFNPSSSVASPNPSNNSAINCPQFVGAKSPRIMVVIPEIHITQKIPDPAGETEIIKKLVAQKFNLVDQSQIAAIRDSQEVANAKKDLQAAKALATRFGADILIIGEAFSELATRQNNLFSSRARVEARAIQTDTAKIIAADGKFGSGLDIAEFVSAKTALRNAGSQWADYFITQVCQIPLNNEPNSSAIEITISGINFTQLKQISDQLEKISGVQSLEKKLTNNVARIDVQFNGNAEKLADAISETKFGLLRVFIVGLSDNKIEINIGK